MKWFVHVHDKTITTLVRHKRLHVQATQGKEEIVKTRNEAVKKDMMDSGVTRDVDLNRIEGKSRIREADLDRWDKSSMVVIKI